MKTALLTLTIMISVHAKSQSDFACATPKKDTLYLEEGNSLSYITLQLWNNAPDPTKPVIMLVDKAVLETHKKRLYPLRPDKKG
jgi:hypothetical protein